MRTEQIGDCTLYLGDCLEVMPTLGKVDAVVADPPYGCTDLEWDRYINQNEFDAICKASDGPIVMFGAALPRCLDAMLSLTPKTERVYVWWNTFTLTHSEGAFWQWQPIYVWRRTKFTNLKRDVIQMAANTGSHTKRVHPTQKPVLLLEQIIAGCPDGIVLDPFMGSGTTGVACVNLGRKFIGIEIEPKYFDIACKRIEEAVKNRQPELEAAHA